MFQYPDLARSFIKGSSMELPMVEDKPFGYSSFAGDIVAMPYAWAKRTYPTMISYTAHEKVSILKASLCSWSDDNPGGALPRT